MLLQPDWHVNCAFNDYQHRPIEAPKPQRLEAEGNLTPGWSTPVVVIGNNKYATKGWQTAGQWANPSTNSKFNSPYPW